jgi:hypothetical protein
MTAFNIVRMRAKPGQEDAFIRAAQAQRRDHLDGMRCAWLIKTGERTYHFIGEWDSMDHLVAARPLMINNLDASRPFLEDLGDGKGITEPASGEAVVELFRRSRTHE